MRRAHALLVLLRMAHGACPNACSGHGVCGEDSTCACFQGWLMPTCSERACPYDDAWVAAPDADTGATHAYGLPERTVDFALPSTAGAEPYRLFNLDVFEYELHHPMPVYGSVPFVMARGAGRRRRRSRRTRGPTSCRSCRRRSSSRCCCRG